MAENDEYLQRILDLIIDKNDQIDEMLQKYIGRLNDFQNEMRKEISELKIKLTKDEQKEKNHFILCPMNEEKIRKIVNDETQKRKEVEAPKKLEKYSKKIIITSSIVVIGFTIWQVIKWIIYGN